VKEDKTEWYIVHEEQR